MGVDLFFQRDTQCEFIKSSKETSRDGPRFLFQAGGTNECHSCGSFALSREIEYRVLMMTESTRLLPSLGKAR